MAEVKLKCDICNKNVKIDNILHNYCRDDLGNTTHKMICMDCFREKTNPTVITEVPITETVEEKPSKVVKSKTV